MCMHSHTFGSNKMGLRAEGFPLFFFLIYSLKKQTDLKHFKIHTFSHNCSSYMLENLLSTFLLGGRNLLSMFFLRSVKVD